MPIEPRDLREKGNHRDGFEQNPIRIPDFWQIWAGAKYSGREAHGARDLANPPATLDEMAAALIAICELSWRSGFKPRELHNAAMEELRRRKKKVPGPGPSAAGARG